MRPIGLILSLAPLTVFADVEFTSPPAGGFVPVGTIDVQWKDSGIAPPIEDLTAYTLILMVGGNQDGEMLPLATFRSQGSFATGDSLSGTISAGIAETIDNGFFFQITSSSTTGGVVINYSDRFTITGLTGTTDSQYRDAVSALDGSTKGPPSVGDEAPASSSLSASMIVTTTQQSRTSATSMVTTTSPPTTSSIPSNGDSSGGGISSGALVGIAIAGVVVGLLGLGLTLWVCLRKRKRKDKGAASGDDTSDLSAEVYRKEMVVSTPPVELDPWSRIVEADHGNPPAEMDSMNIRAELEGDSTPICGLGRSNSHLTEIPPTPISPMTLGTGTMGNGTWDSMRYGLPDPVITPETPGTPVTPRDNV